MCSSLGKKIRVVEYEPLEMPAGVKQLAPAEPVPVEEKEKVPA